MLVPAHLRLSVKSSSLCRSELWSRMVVPFHHVTVGFGKPYARQYILAGEPSDIVTSESVLTIRAPSSLGESTDSTTDWVTGTWAP